MGAPGREDSAVALRRAPIGRPQDLLDDRGAVDPVGEGPPHELAGLLVPERRMATGADADLEVVPAGRALVREDPQSGLLLELGDETRREVRGDVQLTPSERFAERRALNLEANDEPVKVGRVGAPVAGVPAERDLLAALPALDEEGPAPDRRTRLRILDPVRPDAGQIDARERMARQDVPEQFPPAGETGAQDDLDRLRVESSNAANLRLVNILGARPEDRLVGEDEVRSGDRHPVAPAGLRANVVRQRERRPGRERDARDESRPPREIRTDVERRLEHLARDEPEGERSRSRGALVSERREAGGLPERPSVDDRPTHARRLRLRAAGARDGEQRDGERRG